MRSRLFVFLLLMAFGQAIASTCSRDMLCIEENTWQIGVAMGGGVRTNPLVDGDSIPLVLLPDIAWYGKKAYFDNGELGYQSHLGTNFSSELFISANIEKLFFSFWNPANILLPPISVDGDPKPPTQPTYISIDDISYRDWSADIGVRLNWYQTQGTWSFVVLSDLLSVHSGHSVILSYRNDWHWGEWHVSANTSATYKSQKLIDYYYGIGAKDTVDSELWYSATHSIQLTLGVQVSKPINKNWRWIGYAKFTALDNSMTDSPLVTKPYVSSIFAGIGYRF